MKNNIEYRTFKTTFERKEDEKTGQITGTAIVFNSESRNMGFIEKIDKDALKDTDMTDVVATFNHDVNKLLARTASNTLNLKQTDEGLTYSFSMPNTSYANDLSELMSRNDINSSSFAFQIADGGQTWEQRDGSFHRTITKIKKLVDVSIVTHPAYEKADATLRAFEAAKTQYNAEKKVEIDAETMHIYTKIENL